MTHECLTCGELWFDNLPHAGWCPKCGENWRVQSTWDEQDTYRDDYRDDDSEPEAYDEDDDERPETDH